MLGERNLAAKDEGERARSVDYVKSVLTMVSELDGEIVTLVPATVGKVVPDGTEEEEWGWVVEATKECFAHAQKIGVKIAIEPLNRFETYLFNRAAQALALADAVSPDCGVCLDTFHLNIEEEDMYDAIRLAGPRLFDFHVADNNRFACGPRPARLAEDRRHAEGDRLRRRAHQRVRRARRSHPGGEVPEHGRAQPGRHPARAAEVHPGPRLERADRGVLRRPDADHRRNPAAADPDRRAPVRRAGDRMRIKQVQAWWVRIPIEASRQHRSDFGRLTTFDAAILRIETDDGLVGWGEGKNAAGSAGTYGALVHLLNHEFGPRLVGRDPADIAVIWEKLYNGVRHESAPPRAMPCPSSPRRGLTVAAISAVDIALWDILGKSLGQPVWRLLGGRKADRLPAYASGGWADADAIGEQLAAYVAAGGFRAVKMRVGAMDGAPHVSAARVRAARAALGPDVELMVDAHGTYTVAEAKRFARLVADCDLAWFEEPVIADDKPGMAEVRAAGTSRSRPANPRRRASPSATSRCCRPADIFQPDPAFCGGITEAMRIAALASAFNLRLAPHLWAGAPCFFAGLHVCAAAPASFIVEFSLGANPMIHDLVEERWRARTA